MNKFDKISKSQWILDGGNDESYNRVILPKRGTAHSAGYDFYNPNDIVIPSHGSAVIKTGIKCYLDFDKYLALHVRSSMGIKKNLMLKNITGIIDSDYVDNESNEGHILIGVYNYGDSDVSIKSGDRIAQGIINSYYTTDDDNTTKVRTGGVGSTGK